MGPIEPEFFDDDEVRAALANRDIGRLYRLLQRVGLNQRQIAHLTGQSHTSTPPSSSPPTRYTATAKTTAGAAP